MVMLENGYWVPDQDGLAAAFRVNRILRDLDDTLYLDSRTSGGRKIRVRDPGHMLKGLSPHDVAESSGWGIAISEDGTWWIADIHFMTRPVEADY